MLSLDRHPRRKVIVYNKNRPHWVGRTKLSKWIDTINCQRKFNITRFFFENWPFSSMHLNADPSAGIQRTSSWLMFFAWKSISCAILWHLNNHWIRGIIEYNEELCETPFLSLYRFDTYLFDIVGIHFLMHIFHRIWYDH